MTTYYKYRVRCETDSRFEHWILSSNDPIPTTCPVNTAHAIDIKQTTIVDTIEDNTFTVKEESTPTGGNFAAISVTINATKNKITNKSISFPFPISMLAVEFVTDTSHVGDYIDATVGENVIIGIITANISPATDWFLQNYIKGQSVVYNGRIYTCSSDTNCGDPPSNSNHWKIGLEISVSPTVIEHIAIGFYVKLFDGQNGDNVDRVISVEKENNKIYVETNLINSFSVTTPTYIQQTVYTIKDYEIGPPWQHTIGESKIGGSHVPANLTLTLHYTNKSPDIDKKFIGRIEYLY